MQDQASDWLSAIRPRLLSVHVPFGIRRLSADLGFVFLGSAPPLGEPLSAGFRLFSGTAQSAQSAQSIEEGLRGPSL